MKTKKIIRFSRLIPQAKLESISVSYLDLIGANVTYPESKVDKSYFETSASAVKRLKSLGSFDAPLPYDANPYALSAEVARMRSRGVDSAEIYQHAIRAERTLNQMIANLGQSATKSEPETTTATTETTATTATTATN